MREELLGAGSGGVWTTADALACGLSPDQVQRRLERGEWQPLHRGTYASGGVIASPTMRGWAVVRAAGGVGRAWATGRTALRMFDLPLIDDDDPATGACDLAHDDVLVTTRLRGRPCLHPTRARVPCSSLGAMRGCPCVAVEYALLHAAGPLSQEALVCSIDASLHRGLTTTDDLALLVASCAGRPQVARLREAVGLADGRAESPLETLGRLVLKPVLPGLVPQVRILDPRGGVLARVDLGDEGLRLAVEGDGRATHAGMAADDHRRDRVVAARGWHTERYTWFEVRRQQRVLQRRMLAAADARRLREAR